MGESVDYIVLLVLLFGTIYAAREVSRDRAKKRQGTASGLPVGVAGKKKNLSKHARVYLDLISSTLRPGEVMRDYEEVSRGGAWNGESGLLAITTERLIYLGGRDGETIRLNWENNDPTKIRLHRYTFTSYLWVTYGHTPEKFMINHDAAQRFVELAKSSCVAGSVPLAKRAPEVEKPAEDPFRAMYEEVKKRMEES